MGQHSRPRSIAFDVVAGGGAASPVWLRVLANVLDRPVRLVGTAESAARGAPLLAAVGAGAFSSVGEACASTVEVGEPIEPGPDASVYPDAYRVYRELYPALRPTFGRLSALDR